MDEEELARLMRLLALTEANRRSQEEQHKLESIRNEMAEANRLSHEEQQKLESIRNETAGLRQAATEDEHRQKSLPQCPACGGRLDGEFRKCKHCASDLVWIDGHVCEPGQEEALRQRLAAEEEALRQRLAAGQEAADAMGDWASPGAGFRRDAFEVVREANKADVRPGMDMGRLTGFYKPPPTAPQTNGGGGCCILLMGILTTVLGYAFAGLLRAQP